MEIIVNGETRAAARGATIERFLFDHDVDPELVVVERNGEILARGDLAGTVLAPGDRLEVVHFVGGG